MRAKIWLARHAQTLLGSLGRIVEHPVATLMTVAVIAVALALPVFLGVFLQNVRMATSDWNKAFDLSIFMDRKASPARVQALAKQLRARADVATVRIITADQAFKDFKAASGFGHALDALTDNPLPDTLVVTPAPAASNPSGVEALRQAVGPLPEVQTVQIDGDWVKRLFALLDILRRIILIAAGFLGLGVVLVVGNTIRLDILNRRAEIEVMKLVGGSDGFARRPFLYAGVWYGLGGGILALLLVGVSIGFLAGPVERLAGLYGSPFRLAGLGMGRAVAVLALSTGLAWFGSWLAATHHIKQIEPT